MYFTVHLQWSIQQLVRKPRHQWKAPKKSFFCVKVKQNIADEAEGEGGDLRLTTGKQIEIITFDRGEELGFFKDGCCREDFQNDSVLAMNS